MAVTTYTTYGDVRAVLGVVDYELPDSVLSLSLYSNALDLALAAHSGILSPDTVDRNLAEQYTYLNGLIPPLEANQTNMLLNIELFATYVVAGQAAEALAMFAPKSQSDSKASLSRFSSEATFRSVQNAINLRISKVISDVITLFGDTVTPAEPIRVVPPAVNLVTGV